MTDTPTRVGTELSGPIEALLLMSEEPVAAVTLAEALGVPVDAVTTCLADLAEFYDETHRGFELRHVGGGWRLYTRPEHGELISAWLIEGQQARLSQAALETLSVVAYLQPVSRSRVAAVRGVSVDGVMKTLLARGLITEAGHDEGSTATLFVTTELFLEKLGLSSIDELPALAPHLPEAQALEAELAELAASREVATPDERDEAPSDTVGERAQRDEAPSAALGDRDDPLGERAQRDEAPSAALGDRDDPLGDRDDPLGDRDDTLGERAQRDEADRTDPKENA